MGDRRGEGGLNLGVAQIFPCFKSVGLRSVYPEVGNCMV